MSADTKQLPAKKVAAKKVAAKKVAAKKAVAKKPDPFAANGGPGEEARAGHRVFGARRAVATS